MNPAARRPSAVVLISGSGTNLQAIIDTAAAGKPDLDLRVVVSNRPDACGLQRARSAGIDARTLDHRQYADRAAFDESLADLVEEYSSDLIILAGFMRILSAPFVERYEGRILNIHPSLLPKYPGLDTHRRALEAGDVQHGATVHFVTAELDGGPAIIRGCVPVLPGDDPQTLAARVLDIEHRIYPETLRLIAEGRLEWRDRGPYLDGKPLTAPLTWGQ